MSIRTKILLFMLLLMSAIVGTLSLSLYYTEKNILERAEYTRQQQVILAWTQVCRETPPQLGSSDGAHYFDKFFAAPSILERHCIDKTGKIYLSANPTNLGRQAANVTFRTDYPPNDMGFISEAVLPDHRAVIQVDTPIRVRQNEPVLARLVFSKKELNSKMEQKLREASARIYVVSAIALIVGCIGILFLTAFFSNPIQTLISGVRLIGSGNLEHAIIIPGRTEFSALANEINLMARKLRELDKMKSDFTSGITHDLRSPVTGIKLCASNILDEYKTKSFPKIPEQTLHILEYAERLNRFIDSLLEVAKIESGKSHLRISTANLEDIAARVVDSYRPYAQQKKLQVNLVVEHELADIRVDVDKIEQAISNLIGNAVKYTDHGLVTVYVDKESDERQKISVVDTGRGIQPEEKARVFNKFHGVAEAGKGTGLGLYIAKAMVELHGGTIECKSEAGRGSTFTIRLPQRTGHETENTAA